MARRATVVPLIYLHAPPPPSFSCSRVFLALVVNLWTLSGACWHVYAQMSTNNPPSPSRELLPRAQFKRPTDAADEEAEEKTDRGEARRADATRRD